MADFEYTPECIVFDLLRIRLVHGWLVDPGLPDEVTAIGNLSYNQLVEKIIIQKNSPRPELITEGRYMLDAVHVYMTVMPIPYVSTLLLGRKYHFFPSVLLFAGFFMFIILFR